MNPALNTSVLLRKESYVDFNIFHTTRPEVIKRFAATDSRESTARLLEIQDPYATAQVNPQGLSEGYTRALIWGAFGKSIQEQSEELKVTEATVSTQRYRLFERIGATSVSHAVHLAFRDEILIPIRPATPLTLSEKERDILVCLGQGHVQEDAAKRLQISRSTLGNHVRHLLNNNAARNISHAITLGYLSGDIPLPTK